MRSSTKCVLASAMTSVSAIVIVVLFINFNRETQDREEESDGIYDFVPNRLEAQHTLPLDVEQTIETQDSTLNLVFDYGQESTEEIIDITITPRDVEVSTSDFVLIEDIIDTTTMISQVIKTSVSKQTNPCKLTGSLMFMMLCK